MHTFYRLARLAAFGAVLTAPATSLLAADSNKAGAFSIYQPTNGPGKQIVVTVKDDDGIKEWWVYDIYNPDANGGQGKYYDELLHRSFKCDGTKKDDAQFDKKYKTHSGLQIQLIDCDDNDYAWKANPTTTSTAATPTTWHDDDDDEDSMSGYRDALATDRFDDTTSVSIDKRGSTVQPSTGSAELRKTDFGDRSKLKLQNRAAVSNDN